MCECVYLPLWVSSRHFILSNISESNSSGLKHWNSVEAWAVHLKELFYWTGKLLVSNVMFNMSLIELKGQIHCIIKACWVWISGAALQVDFFHANNITGKNKIDFNNLNRPEVSCGFSREKILDNRRIGHSNPKSNWGFRYCLLHWKHKALPTEVVWGVKSLRQPGVWIHSRKIHSSWKQIT